MYFYIYMLSYTYSSPLIFCSSIYISPSSHTLFSIKITTWNSRFFFTCCTADKWRNANTTSCLISRGMWINTSGNSYISFCEFVLFFLYFPRRDLEIICEDLLYCYYNLAFELSGKVFPMTLTLLFFSSILYIPPRYFLSGANKKSSKRSKLVRNKCCQLRALKVLLMIYLSHY